jgi:hypothetical protein
MKFETSKPFTFKNKKYAKNDDIDLNNIKDIIRLNEKGFIKELKSNDIKNIKNNLEEKEINLEEGEISEQASE